MADLPSELPSPEDDPWAPDDSWGWGPAPAPMAGEWVMRSSSTENVASCLALVACLLAAALMI